MGLIFYKLYGGSPSIISRFEENTFRSNYQVFKKAIRHSHLHFQTQKGLSCDVDCWIKGSVGLDYGISGYPISTRFTIENIYFNPYDYQDNLNDTDCAFVWTFLMGPIHQSINTKTANYQSSYDQKSSLCIYTAKKVTGLSIVYALTNGTVDLLEVVQTNP